MTQMSSDKGNSSLPQPSNEVFETYKFSYENNYFELLYRGIKNNPPSIKNPLPKILEIFYKNKTPRPIRREAPKILGIFGQINK